MRYFISALATVLLATAAFGAPEAPLAGGIDVKGMDKSVQPGDDFNAYCNGGWVKATEIPADKPAYGVGSMVYDEAQQRTVALIQEAAESKAADGSDAKKIGDFYASYMDEAGIEAKKLDPLKPMLEQIAAITDKNMLATVLGSTVRADTDPLNATNFHTPHVMGVFIAQSLFDPATNVPYLMQGGLLMPDRDYYVSKSPKMEEIRKAYQAHLAAMFKLAGYSDPAGRAARVFALETKIANAHATRVESEDVKLPVAWKAAELAKTAPGLNWTKFLEAAKLSKPDTFIAWHPKALIGTSALVASEPLDAWKDLLLVHTLDEWGAYLPKAYVDERFAFFGKALSGTPEQRPRWKRGVAYTSDAYGEAIGKLYVAKYFPPEAKAKVQAMVEDLRAAFSKRIDALKWMTPATKAKAKEKVATLKVGVGYPDSWRDYSGLKTVRGDAMGNALRASQFEYEYQLAKLGKPVDRSEWWMTPQTVNAVNLPLQNALNFPAAILQPPFFDLKADAASNYGAIGSVIGHEVSHSFDDSGSQFDAKGLMTNWWTKEDLDHFHESAEALAKQYDGYKPFPDLALNGHQTLGENIADVAGLAAAYDAYVISLKGKPAKVVAGFNGDQQFFIAFAQAWREKMRDEALRQEITTDGHAPAMWRAQTVRNLDPWYAAFKVKPGQKLYLAPKDRVRVW